ncbi:MAG TPA: CRISPR-associated endonuclease Cas1, partial [Chitinispirillaceae bacterium]|nr:CRISPR-associated endonuclease Cas1 [Chitinispirillaceae bacterium]
MSFLYVTEQGAHIKKKGPRIQVVKDEEILADRTIKEITTLVMFGGVHPTTEAMLAILDNSGDVAMMTVDGHFKGKMTGAKSKNSVLRASQYAAFTSITTKSSMARRYVEAKIRNGLDCLTNYHYSNSNPYRLDDTIRRQIENICTTLADPAITLASLRGYEGTGARLYFGEFAKCLMHGRQFPGRKFHPSTDPVNALLSFGYSFVARELEAILEACGLDPYIGFFHEITYGRASLSLDLMEEFRHPLVDRLVLRLFNRKILSDDDFEVKDEGGQVYLKKESLKIFIKQYEIWCNKKNRTWTTDDKEISWRMAMWKQAEKL